MIDSSEFELVIQNICKSFPVRRGKAHIALNGVSLNVRRGEFVVVVGPSGCGKSTLLRLIAGLEEPDSGMITVANRSMAGVPPQDRDLAMVFQGYALYPQMTAREIIAFPLRLRGVPPLERDRLVQEAAALLKIETLLGRRPSQLSGGERQRVAMGRAIVRKPKLFLFDEPLSNLDASLREELRFEIGSLVRRLGVTAVYVTHDHVEAMTLADRIAVLRAGELLQFASPSEIYRSPASSFVGTFLGSARMNLISGVAHDDKVRVGPFEVPRPVGGLPVEFEVGVRPEDVQLVGTDGVAAEVIAVEPLGAETQLVARAGDTLLRVRAPSARDFRRGESVHLAVNSQRLHWFDGGRGGRRLEVT